MKRGYLYILITTLLFSSMEVALKCIAGQLNPIQLNFSRFLVGGLVLVPLAVRELKKRGLTVDGKAVSVTEKEFQLLRLLVENKGITLKKDYLFNSVWGSDSESEPQTLTVHIKWLREKTEKDPKKPEHIITVWGTGYRYE